MDTTIRDSGRRARRIAVALVLAVSAVACEDFLEAENPGAIEETNLTDAKYVTLIAQGVIGEFQFMHGNVAYWNAVFADELFNRATFFEEPLIDQRNITPENGTYSTFLYGPLHRSRWLADDGVRRLKMILGDTASRDLRVARSLAYGGYAYQYLAEMMCNSPIDRSAPLTPDELSTKALERFDEAIAVATAARAVAVAGSAAALASDSIKNFSLVGAARTALYMNDKPKATSYASQVPTPFEFRAYYSLNSTRENNWFWNRLNQSTSGSMANTPFAAITGDPRLPRIATGTRANVPLSPLAFSSYSGTVAGADFISGGFIRIASYLEAQYILAEVNGPVASTLTFVNARRAVGLQPPVNLADAALMAELREQRRRDFYLDNHRLGDLRRYLRFQQIDEFQKGLYPGSTTGETYNAAVTCWPLPLAELNDNPNIPKP
jgi:hypothetical protein